jgi:hypothetical protein
VVCLGVSPLGATPHVPSDQPAHTGQEPTILAHLRLLRDLHGEPHRHLRLSLTMRCVLHDWLVFIGAGLQRPPCEAGLPVLRVRQRRGLRVLDVLRGDHRHRPRVRHLHVLFPEEHDVRSVRGLHWVCINRGLLVRAVRLSGTRRTSKYHTHFPVHPLL